MLEIKYMQSEDVPAVHRLEMDIFSDPWSEQAIQESLSQSHTVMLSAWMDEMLCGYMIFYCSIDEGEIARIAVEKASRRKGVAGHMLLELESICEERGIHKLMLDVRESNQDAIQFYKSNGFTEDGLRKNYYMAPVEDAVLMSRELGK